MDVGENIFIIDPNYVIRKTSRRLRDKVGAQSDKQLVGHACYKVFFQEEQPCRDCPVASCIKQRIPLQQELTQPERPPRRVRATPVIDGEGVSAIIVDCVDDRVRASLEQKPASAPNRNRLSRSSSDSASPLRIVLIDDHFNILLISKSAAALLQPPLTSGIGMNLFAAMPLYGRPDIRSELDHFITAEESESLTFKAPVEPYGEELIEHTFVRLSLRGRPSAVMLLSGTPRGDDFAAMQREKVKLLSLFASKIVHDFRNLLAPVTAEIEFLKSDMISVTSIDGMFQLLDYVDKVQSKIGEMVGALEMLEALKPHREENVTEIDAGKLVSRAASLALLQKPYPQSDIAVALGDDLPLLYGVEASLERALIEVFRGALNAAGEKGRVAVNCSYQHERPGGFVISVRVDAPVPQLADADALLNEFVRSNGKMNKSSIGFLAAYAAVLNHGGTLKVTPRTDRQSEIIIRLPRHDRE